MWLDFSKGTAEFMNPWVWPVFVTVFDRNRATLYVMLELFFPHLTE